MGQKIHPEGFRVGYIHDWKSNWFAGSDYSELLLEDMAIRDHIEQKLAHAGLSDITIQRRGEVEVDIHTARPGIVIGKSGSEVDALRKELHEITGTPVKVNIREVKRPELDAKLVAQSIAEQLQNRVAFRRAMKRAVEDGNVITQEVLGRRLILRSAVPVIAKYYFPFGSDRRSEMAKEWGSQGGSTKAANRRKASR